MLNFCDFIQVYVFSTNHHLKIISIFKPDRFSINLPRTISFIYTCLTYNRLVYQEIYAHVLSLSHATCIWHSHVKGLMIWLYYVAFT